MDTNCVFVTVLVISLSQCLYVCGIREEFVTELCPGTVGPTYGDVLRFNPNSQQSAWVMPTADLDCWVTLRGHSATAGTPQRYSTLQWRDTFSVVGYNAVGCDTAYMEIYDATSSGVMITPALIGPVCGTTLPGTVTTSSNFIIVHLYVQAPPAGTYSNTIVSSQVSNATCGTHGYGTSNTTANSTGVSDVTVTVNPGVTVTEFTSQSNTTSSTGCQSVAGPFINFTADFTSYFTGACSLDNIDDTTQLQCDPGTGRCIDISQRCDAYLANNCGDGGDNSRNAPGNCSTSGTTAMPPHASPLTSSSILPIWILLGLLAALALAYWCCWRPGWCPWRLARLRNVRCCKVLCRCCKPLSRCCKRLPCCRSCGTGGGPCGGFCGSSGGGPAKGCFAKCCRCCNKTESGYPNTHEEYERIQKMTGGNGVAEAPNWTKYASDDGAYVRGMR